MPVILLLALGVIAYSVSNQAKAAINQIQYTPVKVKFVKAGLFSFTFDLYFEITNNTNTSINITGIDGLLKSGATQLGTFVINKPFTIAAGQPVTVVGRVTSSNTEAAKLIYQTLVNKRTPDILFDGAVSTTLLGRVPFKYMAVLGTDLKFKKKGGAV
jgi:LEA14-like dessication related protein